MPPTRFLGTSEKVDLVLDVLRANELHEEKCDALRIAKAQRHTGAYLVPKPCNCWLSEPPEPPALNERDLRVEADARAVTWRPDMSEDEWPAVKITHLPTGHTVTKRARSQIQAKTDALYALAELVAAATP